ncbi:MAG TPA: pilus assembly protein PilM [Chthoniobacterales bacterium]|nr:pilus assembly protein PilM [Chthoniobacterales bacterium]
MAKFRRLIALDLGSQSVGLGIFRVYADGTLELHHHCRRQILVDPVGEAMRQPQMLVVLREMVDALKLKAAHVNYSITGQSVFVRFVDLPQIETEKIQRIIAFEAQQNVPFPIDEVVWDYQLIGGGVNGRVQVMLVAIKADLLAEVHGAIEAIGVKPVIVDVAPMARYNAFRHSYGDLSGCSLLINIGAHTTNLLFIERECCFSRTIPIGGGSITAAIAKEFDEPFAAAELRKHRYGAVSLQDLNDEPVDAERVRVSKVALSIMTRLHTEVMRSISHYRIQGLGSPPDRIFLGGGGATMPRVRDFFSDKLGLPIEFFNPLRNIAMAASAPVEELGRLAHLMGELVGLALRSVGDCPMSINLRPASVARRQQLERRRPFFVLAASFVIFAVLSWGFYYARASQVTRAGAEKIKNINAPMHAVEIKIDQVRQQVIALDEVSVPLIAAINDRFFWTQILEDLNARLPKEDIWITELIPISGGKPVGIDQKTHVENTPVPPRPSTKGSSGGPAIDGLLLRGLYLYNAKQQEVVVDYFKNLAGSPFFNVDPKNQARAIKSTIPDDTEWAFPYELRLDLKKPVKMP